MQKERKQNCFNARLEGVEFEAFCALGQKEREILEIATQKFGISQNTVQIKFYTLRVALQI